MLEKTLESPLDCKEIKPVNPRGNQSWIFIERTDAEAPILWPCDAKSWLVGKDPDAQKDWGQEEKGTTEDEMVGWHHWLIGHKFEQTLEIVKDREDWRATVHRVAKTQTQLNDWKTREEFIWPLNNMGIRGANFPRGGKYTYNFTVSSPYLEFCICWFNHLLIV